MGHSGALFRVAEGQVAPSRTSRGNVAVFPQECLICLRRGLDRGMLANYRPIAKLPFI